jgi:hypothetical protein
MQTNFEPSALGGQPLIAPLRERPLQRRLPRARLISVQPGDLLQARRDALSAQRSEHIAWLALALCSLSALVLSFCL